MALLDSALDRAIRHLMNAIVARDLDAVAASVEPLAAGQLEGLVGELDQYPATFEAIPADADPFRYLIVQNDGGVWISASFWSKEEGASDLELQVVAREQADNSWSLTLEDIHVP